MTPIAVAAGRASATLTNFIVRVDLSRLPADFWTGVDSSLSNLRVRDATSADLPFDLVLADSTAKTGVLYFRAPTISSTADTLFTVGGVSGATPPAVTDPLGRNAVWQDFDFCYIFDANENVDRAGKCPALTLGNGVTILNGYLNFSGQGPATLPAGSIPARTSWTQGITLEKSNNVQATVFQTGSAKIVIDNGTTIGIYDGTWLYPSPNPALSSGVPYRIHQVWNGAASRTVYREGGALAGGTGSQATDSSVTQQSPTNLILGSTGGTSEPLTGWVNRVYFRPEALTPEWVAAEEKSWEDDTLLTYAPPSVPVVTGSRAVVTRISLSWEHMADTVQIRLNGGTPIDVTTQDSYEFTGLSPETTYTMDVRGVNALGVSAWSEPVSVTTLGADDVAYYDDFERTNASTPGTPILGGPYTVRTGTWGIQNGALYAASSTSEAHMTFPGLVNFEATLGIKTPGPNPGLLFRWVDANNTWLLQWPPAGVQLYRRVGGSWIQRGIWGKAVAAGDEIRVLAVGETIHVHLNDELILTAEDIYLPAATTTMGFRFSSDTATRLDEAMVVQAALPADVTADLNDLTDFLALTAPSNEALLYKGRDTKLADEGAVP